MGRRGYLGAFLDHCLQQKEEDMVCGQLSLVSCLSAELPPSVSGTQPCSVRGEAFPRSFPGAIRDRNRGLCRAREAEAVETGAKRLLPPRHRPGDLKTLVI